MGRIANERRVDDKLWKQRVIHLLELFSNHNWLGLGHNARMMDDVLSPWMKSTTSSYNPDAHGWVTELCGHSSKCLCGFFMWLLLQAHVLYSLRPNTIVLVHGTFCPQMIVLLLELIRPKLIIMFLWDSLNEMFHHQEDFRHQARY